MAPLPPLLAQSQPLNWHRQVDATAAHVGNQL
jgi:hypothetical protein